MAQAIRLPKRGLLITRPHCDLFFVAQDPKTWHLRGGSPPKVMSRGESIAILRSDSDEKGSVPVVGVLTFVEAVRLDSKGHLDMADFSAQFAHHCVSSAELANMRRKWKGDEVWAWKFHHAAKEVQSVSVKRTSQEVWVTITNDKIITGGNVKPGLQQATLASLCSSTGSSTSSAAVPVGTVPAGVAPATLQQVPDVAAPDAVVAADTAALLHVPTPAALAVDPASLPALALPQSAGASPSSTLSVSDQSGDGEEDENNFSSMLSVPVAPVAAEAGDDARVRTAAFGGPRPAFRIWGCS